MAGQGQEIELHWVPWNTNTKLAATSNFKEKGGHGPAMSEKLPVFTHKVL
jgi:hypothetical protein